MRFRPAFPLVLIFSVSIAFSQGRLSEDERRALQLIASADRSMSSLPPDFNQAVMSLLQAIDLAPENPSALNKLATAYNNLLEYEEAAEASMKSLSLTGGMSAGNHNPAAYENLAFAQLHLGDPRGAVANASIAIMQNPSSAMAYAVRAFAYEETGDGARKLENIRAAANLSAAFQTRYEAALAGKRIFKPRSSPRRVGTGGAGLGRGMLGALGLGVLVSLGFIGVVWAGRRKMLARSAASREDAQRQTAAEGPADSGELAGKYRLSRIIGKGGMGQVWEAKDLTLGRIVAIKRMTEDLTAMGSAGRDYYMQEARTVAGLHHPHIIGIYEILDLDSGLYLVFEMARGKTIQHLLAEKHNLSLSETAGILRPVCDALEFAHKRGVVHRDLKPANIMLTEQGFVKVMDFGIARKMNTTVAISPTDASERSDSILMDHTRTIVGTPVYMAPEAEEGAVSAISDVFALGVCFYEMLTGRLPYDARGAAALKLDRQYIPPSQHDGTLGAAVDQLVADALDPNTQTRIPSAREFHARLDQLGSAAQAGRT